MSIVSKIRIKARSLSEFYFFQSFGIPEIKEDKISKSILKKYLPVNPVIIDCGAHVGIDSIELYKILGGEVHAFEPVDNIFTQLTKNTSAFSNIHCYKLALGDKNGSQFFYVSEGASDASSSLLEPKDHLLDHPNTTFNNKIEVQTLTLDEWAKIQAITKVDMLWLDMQGFELNLLKASPKILSTVQLIHTEVSLKETYKGVPLYKEYRSFLEGKGFKLALEAIPSGWDMGNVLFARTK